jgi:hypothetical protein
MMPLLFAARLERNAMNVTKTSYYEEHSYLLGFSFNLAKWKYLTSQGVTCENSFESPIGIVVLAAQQCVL